VTRQDQWLQAMCLAMVKDRSITGADACRVLELAVGLPEDGFPAMTAEGVIAFIRHGLQDGAAPEWVQEARLQRNAAETAVIVERRSHGASWGWWEAALRLYEESAPASSHPLFGKNSAALMSVGDWNDLVEWVRSVPGWSESDVPFWAKKRE
jgi:hypothetical protein